METTISGELLKEVAKQEEEREEERGEAHRVG